ncbi:MAG: hypothetical protein HY060_06770 [Proteobacteria bacterium]|nr:hypothetical protein [Pseudomonadota bacterium]
MLLLASLCLPMSSCVGGVPGTDDKPAATSDNNESQKRTYHYVWTPTRWAEPEPYLFLLGFAWPTGAVLLFRRTRARWVRTCAWLAEPILLAGTTYLLWAMTLFGDPEVGAFVAAAGIASYALGWIAEAGQAALQRH